MAAANRDSPHIQSAVRLRPVESTLSIKTAPPICGPARMAACFAWPPAMRKIHFAASRSASSRTPNELVQVWAMLEDREGSLWVGTKFGLMRRTPDGQVLYYAVRPQANTDQVYAVLEDRDGRLWLGHESGLVISSLAGCWTQIVDRGIERVWRAPQLL